MLALLAVQFTDTVNLGAILIFILGVVGAAVFTIRSNVAQTWREVAEGERETVTLRDKKIVELTDQLAAQAEQMSRLQAATDLSDHQKVMREYNETLAAGATAAMMKAVRESEERILDVVGEQTVTLKAIQEALLGADFKAHLGKEPR